MEWRDEKLLIRAAAERHGVDPRFIATIRKVENGGPGREFGVLSVHAPDYVSQLKEACISVAHRLFRYPRDRPSSSGAGAFLYTLGGLRYSEAFISYFAGIWAPLAGEDPAHLNQYWFANALAIYDRACGAEGLDGMG
jgi:hypothetical protein